MKYVRNLIEVKARSGFLCLPGKWTVIGIKIPLETGKILQISLLSQKPQLAAYINSLQCSSFVFIVLSMERSHVKKVEPD